MDDNEELLRQIKTAIDKALRLAEAEEEKVKWYRLPIRDKVKARNYDNIKSLLKTISRNIELNTENK